MSVVNKTMPNVAAADRNSDAETADAGSCAMKAIKHADSALSDDALRCANGAQSPIKTITAARTAEIGMPENARYATTNAATAILLTHAPIRRRARTRPTNEETMARWDPETATRCARPVIL